MVEKFSVSEGETLATRVSPSNTVFSSPGGSKIIENAPNVVFYTLLSRPRIPGGG